MSIGLGLGDDSSENGEGIGERQSTVGSPSIPHRIRRPEVSPHRRPKAASAERVLNLQPAQPEKDVPDSSGSNPGGERGFEDV
jgi:hypothetical protein